ncbi:MAG: hypothetical protein GF308_15470 [Candidatus Heimdallarchaeota archaeon]|nr:hypothetical protein [Candidatus Heimdallarchaeota archaeon]
MSEGTMDSTVAQEPIIEEPKIWLEYQDFNLLQLILSPFKIYGKQFHKFYLLSLIVEFILFGLFFPIEIDFIFDPNQGTFVGGIEVINETTSIFVFPIVLLGIMFIVIRMALITETAKKTIKKGNANIFRVIDKGFNKFGALAAATGVAIVLGGLTIPFILLGMAMHLSVPGVAWGVIIFAFLIIIFLTIKFCLFIPSLIVSDEGVGEAFQDSWRLTSGLNVLKIFNILLLYFIISVLAPTMIIDYFSGTPFYWSWFSFGMVFVKALFYPLLDIALTITYTHTKYQSILHTSQADFKEK